MVAKEEYDRKRTKAVIKLENGREIPATLSCRRNGECVILPRPMVEIIFPRLSKVRKLIEGEKAKKEVKK